MDTLFYPLITKRVQLSPQIEKFELNLGVLLVSIWVIKAGNQLFLVDSAMGNMANFVLKKYFPQESLTGVFLTHGHADHIGGITSLKKTFPKASVVLAQEEFPYVAGEKPYPSRVKLEKKLYNPDEFIDFSEKPAKDLLQAAGLIPLSSPGHSPGHHCFYHPTADILLAGDLFTTNRSNQLALPMKKYTADLPLALKSGRQLLQKYPDSLLSVCHGGEVKRPYEALLTAPWFNA